MERWALGIMKQTAHRKRISVMIALGPNSEATAGPVLPLEPTHADTACRKACPLRLQARGLTASGRFQNSTVDSPSSQKKKIITLLLTSYTKAPLWSASNRHDVACLSHSFAGSRLRAVSSEK